MASPIEALQAAGFKDDEVADWATQRRDVLTNAGFKENEIDAYFTGGVKAPETIPDAMSARIEAGAEAQKREGGLLQTLPQFGAMITSPEGRGKLWDSVAQYPAHFMKSMADTFAIPGDVNKGTIDLTTEEGMEKAIGLGALIGFGRLSKTTLTGKTSGLSVQMGEQVARIDRGPTGEIVETPIGGLAKAEDFPAAARVVTEGDASLPVQEKLLQAYEEQGRHPAEVAHDAARDPVVAQRLLSKDPKDLPYGEAAPDKVPEPTAPKEVEPPPEGSIEAAQQKVLDRISIGEGDAKRPYSFDRLYTEAIDDLHPIQKASEDAYQLARLTRGQFGKAEVFLEQGTFDFNTYKTNGAPLAEILKPVRDDLNGLRAYMTSKRAIELEASGRKTGVPIEEARQVVAEGGQYEKIAADLVGYQARVLQYLKDAGVLGEEAHAAMLEANKHYVPFYRVMGNEAGGGGAGKSLGPVNPIKRLKGSTRKIVDPIESIIKNTYAYVSIAERNQAGIALIDALKAQGEKVNVVKAPKAEPELIEHLTEQGVTDPGKVAEFVQAATPPDGTTIRAYRNGVREEVTVNDTDLVRAFQGLDAQSTGMLTKIFSVPARTLRAGAVLAPDFMARNVIRDFMTAIVNSKGLFTPLDTAKGLVSVVRRDADFQNWLKAGGANSTMVALDRAYLQESLTKLAGETGLMERSWNVVKSPLNGLRMMSELLENATRLGEFKKVAAGETSKAALQEAAFASREVTLDFARMGAKMRAYNMLTAFANAQIQGVDRIVRAFGDRPVNTTLKVAGSITMPSILLWWANQGDKRVEELPPWQKDLFWIIATDKWQPIDPADAAGKPAHMVRTVNGKTEFNNGSIWRIPKPFELGVMFGSGVERVLDATIGKNKEAFDHFTKSVVGVLTPNIFPTAAQPLIEQWANRSSFTDRTLIPADMEKHLPEYQYTPYTTQLSRKLGQVVAAFPGMREASTDPGNTAGPAARALSSPILIENYIRSWTGGMGVYALNAADAALRKTGVLPDPVTPTPTLADIPFVKAFAVRYPSAGTQSIQDFYDENEKTKRFFDTYMARAKEGDVEAMGRISEAGGPQMFMRLDAIKDTLSEHSKLIRDIYKNPQMPADEKRQLIDGLYYSMIEIGRAGRDMQRAAKIQP